MAVTYQRETIVDVKNYLDRTGIVDRDRRSDIYEFIKHLIDIGAYENIEEIFLCQSPYNDQTKSSVMAFKDPAKDGAIYGSFLNWDENGIETDANCSWASELNLTDPGILSLFKMTSPSFTTSADDPIFIYTQNVLGSSSSSRYVAWGTTGTGGPVSVYENIYDSNPSNVAGHAGAMRHGFRILSYSGYFKDRFAFIGYSYPLADTESLDVYNPLGGMTRTTLPAGTRYEFIRENVADHNASGSYYNKYYVFTSQSSANTATGYHTFHILWKQHSENYAANGIYQSIMDKCATTIGRNLVLP